MGKYKWNLGIGSICGLAGKSFTQINYKRFHADFKEKNLRRFKWKRNAD